MNNRVFNVYSVKKSISCIVKIRSLDIPEDLECEKSYSSAMTTRSAFFSSLTCISHTNCWSINLKMDFCPYDEDGS